MVWAKDNPATETVAQVYDSSTADETDNIWESCPQCQDENLENPQKIWQETWACIPKENMI